MQLEDGKTWHDLEDLLKQADRKKLKFTLQSCN